MATSPICKTNLRKCFISVTITSFQVFKALFLLKGREEFITFWAYAFDLVTRSFESWSVTNKLKKNISLPSADYHQQGHQFSFLHFHWNGTPLNSISTWPVVIWITIAFVTFTWVIICKVTIIYCIRTLIYWIFVICTRWVITWKVAITWCNRTLIY